MAKLHSFVSLSVAYLSIYLSIKSPLTFQPITNAHNSYDRENRQLVTDEPVEFEK